MAKLKHCILTLMLLTSCGNRLKTDFFRSLFNVSDAKVELICSNEFVKNADGSSNLIPRKNYYSRQDSILAWRKTPVDKKDTMVFNKRFTDYNGNAKCFSQNYFFNLLKQKGNYYSAYYYHYTNAEVESFQWFIVDGKTHYIYIQSVKL